MKLHELRPNPKAIKKEKRIGRGDGANRGQDGAQSRSGYKRRAGFEGGQTPLYRRLPKFSNLKRKEKKYIILDLAKLVNHASGAKIKKLTPESLLKTGILKKPQNYKILGKAKITEKLEFHAHAFSSSAKEIIEQQKSIAVIL